MTGQPLIRVGAQPELFAGEAVFFDGAIAQPQAITFQSDPEDKEMILRRDDTILARWSYGDIRSVSDQAGGDQLILTCKTSPAARLILTDTNAVAGLRARAPRFRKRTRHVGRGRLLGWAVAALASVALIVTVLVPLLADRLATVLPESGEVALGDATLENIRTGLDRTGFRPVPFCEAPEGTAALDDLMTQVTGDLETAYPVRLAVLDHPMVNAFALPGGRIIVFRGLIKASETPDEVAAVLAHELGHVVARDPTRIALRSVGTLGVVGLLLGDFAGGTVVLFLTERLIQAAHTQEAEANADTFAHERLREAGITPAAIGTFFDRLQGRGGDTSGLVSHFQSHPALGDRIAAARGAAEIGGPYRAALDDDGWAAIQAICDGPSQDLLPPR